MKNRLVSDETRKNYKLAMGVEFSERRMIGMSTGIAMKLIGESMIRKGAPVELYDHMNSNNAVSPHHIMMDKIKEIVQRLDLKFLKITTINKKPHIVYEIFDEEN